MSRFERILIVLLFTGVLVAVRAQDSPQVCITDGCLIGINETSYSGRTFFSYLGIPYAQPPIGDLRFRAPQAPTPWDTFYATNDSKICSQSVSSLTSGSNPGSEDCLYLNVYTPQVGNSSALLPVMVWLHPSGWQFWAGTRAYFAGNYLLDRDVVVVAPNYRMNVFGFLSTGDAASPGNWGLKDQTFALEWTRNNIAAFGGDPNSVTIFGQSTGGQSAHYHMLSPLSRGLFHRVIAQSGNAITPSAYSCVDGAALNTATLLGQHLNCSTDNTTVLVECLRGISAEDLLNSDSIFGVWNSNPQIPYPPVKEPALEGAFLTSPPNDLIVAGNFSDVPLLTGHVEKDGTLFSAEYVSNQTLLTDMEAQLIISFPSTMIYNNATSTEIPTINQLVKNHYFGDANFTTDQVAAFTDMFSDRYFFYPFVKQVKEQLQNQKSPIYTYIFGFRSAITFADTLGYPSRDYNGTAHIDDLIYLFPVEKTFFQGYVHTAAENATIQRMLDLWTNFAKYSNPTPEGYDIEWLQTTADNGYSYLAINGADDISMVNSTYHPEGMALWESLDSESNGCQLQY